MITEEGKKFNFSEPYEVPSKMEDLIKWFHKKMEDPNLLIASFLAELHHRFILIHPFDDGNGRITRLWINYVLLYFGYPPLIIKSEDKRNYFAALQRADNGDIDSLAIYLGKTLVLWLEIGIKAAKGEDISETGDLDKEIDLFIRERTGKEVLESLSKDSAISLIDSLDILFKNFKNKFKKFNKLFNHRETKQYIHIQHPSDHLLSIRDYDKYKITFKNVEDIKRELGLLEDLKSRDMILSRPLSFSSPSLRLSNLLGYSYFNSHEDILRHVSICIDLSYRGYMYDTESLEGSLDMKVGLCVEMDTSKYKISIIFNDEIKINKEKYYNQSLAQKEADEFIEQGKEEFFKLLRSTVGKDADDKK